MGDKIRQEIISKRSCYRVRHRHVFRKEVLRTVSSIRIISSGNWLIRTHHLKHYGQQLVGVQGSFIISTNPVGWASFESTIVFRSRYNLTLFVLGVIKISLLSGCLMMLFNLIWYKWRRIDKSQYVKNVLVNIMTKCMKWSYGVRKASGFCLINPE